jgi:phosphoserine phosphatase
MFTATLIADPQGPGFDPVPAESLRNAWGGGAIRWLAPRVACEFGVPAVPDNRWQVWADLQGLGIDLVVQRTAGRQMRILIADMDSTMIRQECIDELAAEAGVGDRVAAITVRAMNGELDFEGALLERVALLRGLPEAVIARVLDRRITMMPGGAALVATMKAHGARCALVSGGFTAFTGPVAARLGFDEHRANRLIVSDGVLTGDVARPILGRAAKVEALRDIAARMGLTPADAIAVGDGANDLGMLGLAGTGVALHAKPVVQAECDIRINQGDLTALLYLQGYAQAEFTA